MVRKTTISLNCANIGKLEKLKTFMSLWSQAVNQYIDLLWEAKRFTGSFVRKDVVDKIDLPLSYIAKQKAACIALQIVKSQRKKYTKTKPHFSGKSMELDQRFIEIQNKEGAFDLWIKFIGFGDRSIIRLPAKKHIHFNKFANDNWTLKKTARLWQREDGKLFLNLFFEKQTPELKIAGDIIGLDCGYKKLAVLSNGQMIGAQLQAKIEKIARKKQGSKAFKRALTERDNYIDKEIKVIPFVSLKTIVVEDLKNVKRGTKGKIRKQFNNKLQRWTYAYFLNRLEQSCEVVGVQCHRINPAYTSQTCPECHDIHKENRQGEMFKCRRCGYTLDADLNASVNILNKFLLQDATESCNQENFAPEGA